MASSLLLSPRTLSLPNPLSSLSLSLSPFPIRLPFPPPRPAPSLTILNGGGPRTFPGGVSKWTWKRMQSKKAKQLLKARLLRERQIYDVRKRSGLKAAVAHLEKPWEEVSPFAALDKAPTIFSVTADDQLRALADRFQRPGGFDMWSDRDGPQVLRSIASGELPASRFFPKGVAQSVKPYGEVFDDWIARGAGGGASRRQRRTTRPRSGSEGDGEEGVRPNDYEKGSGRTGPTAEIVDVEVVDRREGVRSNYSERGNAKAAGTRRPRGDSEEEEGVRRNAYEKGNGRAGSRSNDRSTLRPAADIVNVADRREGFRSNYSERGDAKAAVSERYGLIGQRHRGNKNVSDRITPRPNSKLYNGRGGNREQIGDSRWDSGHSGSSTNHRRSR